MLDWSGAHCFGEGWKEGCEATGGTERDRGKGQRKRDRPKKQQTEKITNGRLKSAHVCNFLTFFRIASAV